MSPFLRWGIFSILVVGALVLAYNASKDIATTRAREPAAAASPATPSFPEAPPVSASAVCEAEYAVARLAREARASGEPLDRLLRIREISFEENAERRERLSSVARRWFADVGEIDATSLRNVVVAECEEVTKR